MSIPKTRLPSAPQNTGTTRAVQPPSSVRRVVTSHPSLYVEQYAADLFLASARTDASVATAFGVVAQATSPSMVRAAHAFMRSPRCEQREIGYPMAPAGDALPACATACVAGRLAPSC